MAAVATAREECPWCGSVITHAKFLEVKERIRVEERKQHDAIAAELRAKHEEALKERDEKLQAANLERAKLEARMKSELELATAAATKAAEAKAVIELQRAREVLDTKHQQDLLEVKADAAKTIANLERELQAAKSATPIEKIIDVFAELKATFEDDRIIALPSDGGGAATILVEIRSKNTVCGTIMIDARSRKAWQNNFASKLHDEMIERDGEHAILTTLVFPKEQDQVFEHQGVLVMHPARVVEIVRLLRRSMIKMSSLRASNEQRAEKKTKLYEFITSSAGRQRLAETGALAKKLQDIDAEEAREHQKIWTRRNDLERKIQRISEELVDKIDELLEGSAK